MYILTWLYQETNHIGMTRCYQGINFLLGHRERVAHHATCLGIVLEVLYLLTLGIQFLGSIKGNICLTCIQQYLDIFSIDISTLALTIRTMITTKAHTFVKLNAQPIE